MLDYTAFFSFSGLLGSPQRLAFGLISPHLRTRLFPVSISFNQQYTSPPPHLCGVLDKCPIQPMTADLMCQTGKSNTLNILPLSLLSKYRQYNIMPINIAC